MSVGKKRGTHARISPQSSTPYRGEKIRPASQPYFEATIEETPVSCDPGIVIHRCMYIQVDLKFFVFESYVLPQVGANH